MLLKWNISTKTQGKEIKIVTPKQLLDRLPIALVQVKAENLLYEIRQVIRFLYREKEITKQVYNNMDNTK